MTLQQAKDQVAKKYGFDDWWSIDFNKTNISQEAIRDEAAELYARSKQMESEQIYISTDRPHNVYCAFTDEERAKIDTEESGVTCTSVTLHRGPRPEFK